ncbi:MAG: DUF1524 domain-containing protein [Clostridia bacterium]|nr:DUF1524 domain-containing protein [Clostridia bacterium]
MNENLKIVTIRELLNENLKIPGYQRPYRWSTESAVTLVMDSYGAFANKVSEYRIGSVVLHKTIDYTKVNNADYKNRTGFAIDRIVFTYLDYILCRDNATEFKDFQFRFRTSIEHFFPQNPINGENTVDEKNRNSFGNLALITVSANSKFSNMLPIHKVEQYKDIIEQSPKLMRMKKLLDENNRVWDDAMVEKHNAEMLNLLKLEINQHM